MAAIPLLAADAGPGMRAMWSLHWVKSDSVMFPMDSLRIDVIGATARAIRLEAVVQRLLERLRVRTQQWWITRLGAGYLKYERNQFPIGRDGATRSRAANAEEHMRIPFGFETGINDAVWTTSVEEAVRGLETSVAEISLLDAFYFVAAGDARSAVMYSAWALEQAVGTEFARIWRQAGKQRRFRRGYLNGNDATRHISVDADKHFGRSFNREFPRRFLKLRQIWRARDVAAHGGRGGAYREVAEMKTEQLEELVRAVKVALRWLRSL